VCYCSAHERRTQTTGERPFYAPGFAHSILGGSAREPTLWRAVQRGAWETLEPPAVAGRVGQRG